MRSILRWPSRQITCFLLILCSSNFSPITVSAQSRNQNSKRGLPYSGPRDPDDYALLFSDNSSISWYHNWSPNPSRVPSSAPHPVEFIPMIHGTSNLEDDVAAVRRYYRNLDDADDSNFHRRHVLTFNEPDGSISSGGSDVSPADAARAYLSDILPLRSSPSNLLISHPVVTGSGNGLNWLKEFNTSCHDLAPNTGCPIDFITVHFYGGFEGLASWLGTVNDFYNADPKNPKNLPMYITEFALPQSDATQAGIVLNQSLPFLDSNNQSFAVEGYAWFGLFRTSDANSWTGAGPSMLDSQGRLTQLGAVYLGGDEAGFAAGQRGDAARMFGAGWFDDGYSSGNGGGHGTGDNGGSGSVGSGSRQRITKMVARFIGTWALYWSIV